MFNFKTNQLIVHGIHNQSFNHTYNKLKTLILITSLFYIIWVLKYSGHYKTIDNFTYADGDINDIILECMDKTAYTGVGGGVVFRMRDPDRLIRIDRIQGICWQTRK